MNMEKIGINNKKLAIRKIKEQPYFKTEGERNKEELQKKYSDDLRRALSFPFSWGSVEGLIYRVKKKEMSIDLKSIFQDSLVTELDRFEYGSEYNLERIVYFAGSNNYELDLKAGEVMRGCYKAVENGIIQSNYKNIKAVVGFCDKNGVDIDVRDAVQVGIENLVRKKENVERIINIINIVRESRLSIDLNFPEFIDFCVEGVREISLEKRFIGAAIAVVEFAHENNIALDMEASEMGPVLQVGLSERLQDYSIERVGLLLKLADENKVSLDFDVPEVGIASQVGLEKLFQLGDIDEAEHLIEFAKEKGISLDLGVACSKGLTENLDRLKFKEVVRIIDFAKEVGVLETLNVEAVFQSRLELFISRGDGQLVSSFIEIMKENNVEIDYESQAKNYPSGLTMSVYLKLLETPQVGEALVRSLVGLTNFSFKEDVQPIIKAQSVSAFLYFNLIKEKGGESFSRGDIDYMVNVAKKYGTQARNILENILLKVESISGERDVIEGYVGEIRVIDFSLYEEYKIAKLEGAEDRIGDLKEEVARLRDSIYRGNVEEKEFESRLYPAVLYNIFPPAIGITQEQYMGLVRNRPDRQGDVSEHLAELQHEQIEVRTGKYQLSEGEELNLENWTILGNAIKKVNEELDELKEGKLKVDEREIADRLLGMYKNGDSEKPENQVYLFENMYRYHLAQDGGRMESGFEISVPGLMQYKEFVGDRIKNDLIKSCLKEWKKSNKDEFDKLRQDALNRMKKGQVQNYAKVKNMLTGINKQKNGVKREKAIVRLDEYLKHFGLSYELVKEQNPESLRIELEAVVVEYEGDLVEESYQTQEYYDSPAFLEAFDKFSAKHDVEELMYKKIGSDLVAGINKSMRQEVDKFEFEGELGGEEKKQLEFMTSKRKEHGVIGYNMGVCVAPDEQLWNDEKFSNDIIFDPELKQAMGGMHLLERDGHLCLPGINPSLGLLNSVDNEELFDLMIERAKRIKEKLGLDKLLIPIDLAIHSNRTQIQEIIRKKNYNKYILKQEAKFSYDPHQYNFRECFEVE